jgi:hypothetical protein
MSNSLALVLVEAFAKENEFKPMWTIQEIENWLKNQREFKNSEWLSSGLALDTHTPSSNSYRLEDGSTILITADRGIEEFSL